MKFLRYVFLYVASLLQFSDNALLPGNIPGWESYGCVILDCAKCSRINVACSWFANVSKYIKMNLTQIVTDLC